MSIPAFAILSHRGVAAESGHELLHALAHKFSYPTTVNPKVYHKWYSSDELRCSARCYRFCESVILAISVLSVQQVMTITC